MSLLVNGMKYLYIDKDGTNTIHNVRLAKKLTKRGDYIWMLESSTNVPSWEDPPRKKLVGTDGFPETETYFKYLYKRGYLIDVQRTLKNLRILRHVAKNKNLPEDVESVVAAYLSARPTNKRGTNANTRRLRIQRNAGMLNIPSHLRNINSNLFKGGRTRKSR